MSLPPVKVLFDENRIAARNKELASEIAGAGFENLLVVAVLKGSFVFAADLLRAMHASGMAPEMEFVHLSSYRDAQVSSGQVTDRKSVV